MAAQRATPQTGYADGEYARLKRRSRSVFWSSMILATGLHFLAFAFWPELATEDFSFAATEFTAIDLPPTVEVPPPPEAIARPATPIIATADVDEDITIAPTTFEDNPVEHLPPPPSEVSEEATDIAAHPTFTPFTVAPRILNREEIVKAMLESYPPLLRQSGIGGLVQVYFFIDENGIVQTTRVNRSSGYESLDQAAINVANLYRFSPALNRDARVPVWVSFPIEFRVIR
ncbi:MAG: energy transducer TonB [Gemmatimonadota bacterium]|nr:energy transducer TonB [Gemmatimonadota bacterium]